LTKWVEDIISPTILSLGEVHYEQSDSASFLQWSVSDENPDSYVIKRNGSLVKEGDWFSGAIVLEINKSSSLGRYLYILEITDISGNIATDSVIVVIEDTIAPVFLGAEYNNKTKNILWWARDRNPGTFSVLKDGKEVSSGNWVSEGLISVNAEIPKRGSCNYTIVMRDSSGNIASSTVFVLPISSSSSSFSSLWNLFYLFVVFIGISLLIIAVVVIVKNREVLITIRKEEQQINR